MGCRLLSIAFTGVKNGKETNIQPQDVQHMQTNASKAAVVILSVVVVVVVVVVFVVVVVVVVVVLYVCWFLFSKNKSCKILYIIQQTHIRSFYENS